MMLSDSLGVREPSHTYASNFMVFTVMDRDYGDGTSYYGSSLFQIAMFTDRILTGQFSTTMVCRFNLGLLCLSESFSQF